MTASAEGRVIGLAVKRVKRKPLDEVDSVEITEDGIVGNIPQTDRRRVTLIDKGDWEAAQGEIDGSEPWHLRRANILVEGLKLAQLIDRDITIGDVHLRINGETEPCGLMDRLQPGLRQALTPGCRGGVYGSVIQGGAVSIGETVRVLDGSN